jgi:hypothetical protein
MRTVYLRTQAVQYPPMLCCAVLRCAVCIPVQVAALAVLCFAIASYMIYMKFTGMLGGLLLGECWGGGGVLLIRMISRRGGGTAAG